MMFINITFFGYIEQLKTVKHKRKTVTLHI